MSITEDVALFVEKTRYDDLPLSVGHETKRLILDSIGCTLGGLRTKKGEIALRLARSLGGPSEASLLGTQDRISAANSAFATGELMNALDYEALLSPPDHATPYVLAALLAISEKNEVSGTEFITATAIAHELATRLAASLDFGRRFTMKLPERGLTMSMPTPGYGLCAIAGAAAAGRIMGMDADKIAHAMGLAGYMAPVPMLMKFATTVPASLAKYQSAGALSLQEVVSVMWADMGCTGDKEILDGEYGFWRAMGCEGWTPETLTKDLGKTWLFPMRLFYKKFPCCGAMQNSLAHFSDIVTERDLSPENITALTIKLNPLAELPLWRNERIENHIDAQFNIPYVFAAVANRLEIGPSWQMEEAFNDDGINRFMKKVRVVTDLDNHARRRPDVEVSVGKGATKKVLSGDGFARSLVMDDKILAEKFRRNTRSILDEEQAERAISLILGLEHCPGITELMHCLSPKESNPSPEM